MLLLEQVKPFLFFSCCHSSINIRIITKFSEYKNTAIGQNFSYALDGCYTGTVFRVKIKNENGRICSNQVF